MLTDDQIQELQRCLDLVNRKVVYFLIERSKFERLPEKLRAYATNSPPELLLEIAQVMGSEFRAPALYLTDKAMIAAGAIKRRESEETNKKEFKNFAVSPLILLQNAARCGIEKLVVHPEFEGGFEISSELFGELEKLLLLLKLAKLPEMFLIRSRSEGFVAIEEEKKRYALAFIEGEHAQPMLDKLTEQNKMDRYKIIPLKPKAMVKKVMNAGFDGIVLNFGTDTEKFINAEQLEKLYFAVQFLSGPGVVAEILAMFKGKR